MCINTFFFIMWYECKGTILRFVIKHKEIGIIDIVMYQFTFYFLLTVCMWAIIIILAFINLFGIKLTKFLFVIVRMIQKLDLCMSIWTFLLTWALFLL